MVLAFRAENPREAPYYFQKGVGLFVLYVLELSKLKTELYVFFKFGPCEHVDFSLDIFTSMVIWSRKLATEPVHSDKIAIFQTQIQVFSWSKLQKWGNSLVQLTDLYETIPATKKVQPIVAIGRRSRKLEFFFRVW